MIISGRRLNRVASGLLLAAMVVLVAYWGTAFMARPAVAQDTYAIVINVPEHRLYLYQGSVLIATYPVAVGKPHTPTPRGEFTVTQKAIWGDGFGTRWIRFSVPWGIYGIHGTNKPWSVGTVASHGCIRMFNRNVEELYAKVAIGTPVTVVGPTPYVKLRRPLSPGAIGQDVVELQRLLRLAHVYSGRLDGLYSPLVEQAVKDFQRQHNLPETGSVNKLLIRLLQEKTGQAHLMPGYLGNRGALSLRHTT